MRERKMVKSRSFALLGWASALPFRSLTTCSTSRRLQNNLERLRAKTLRRRRQPILSLFGIEDSVAKADALVDEPSRNWRASGSAP